MNVDYMSHSGSDLLVVNAARTSFAKESKQFDAKDRKLLRFLAREGHWLPFRHPQLTLRIYAPLFVIRQLDKHQVGFSTSEVSRRYVTEEPEFYRPLWRHKPEGSIKQGSGVEYEPHEWLILDAGYDVAIGTALETYKYLMKQGVAPEQARVVLPQNMFTTQVKTGSLLGWMQMYKLRSDDHAQVEIQDLASMVYEHLLVLFPESTKAIMEFI